MSAGSGRSMDLRQTRPHRDTRKQGPAPLMLIHFAGKRLLNAAMGEGPTGLGIGWLGMLAGTIIARTSRSIRTGEIYTNRSSWPLVSTEAPLPRINRGAPSRSATRLSDGFRSGARAIGTLGSPVTSASSATLLCVFIPGSLAGGGALE